MDDTASKRTTELLAEAAALYGRPCAVCVRPICGHEAVASIAVRNLEITVKARSANILTFLGVEPDGNPGLEHIDGRIYVDADAEAAVLDDVFQETLRRCPVTQSLLRQVPVNVELRTV